MASPNIVEALRKLQPGRPADDAEYIARDEAILGRGWDVLERIEALLAAGVRLRALLHGCTGVGKTTELVRWERRLAAFRPLRVSILGMDPYGSIAAHTQAVAEPASSLFQSSREYSNTGKGFDKFLDQLAAAPDAPGLLLVDGTDLLSHSQAEAWFGPGSPILDPRLPPIIFTAPHAWALQTGPGGRDERIEAVWHLPPFPVVDEEGNPRDNVVTWLVAGLSRRIGDLDLFEDPDLLRRIVRSSGGVPRHAVILLRQAALAAATDTRIRARHVLEAERELRQDLRHTVTDPATAQMHVSGAILSYEGTERRFERPHPLLAP